MPTLTSKRVAAAAGVVSPVLTKKDRQILATAIGLATEQDAFSILISGAKHGVKALIYLKQPVRPSAALAAEEDGDDLEGDGGDVAGAQGDAAGASAPAADAARRAARVTVQQPAKAAAAKAAKAAAKAAEVSAKAGKDAASRSAAPRSQESGSSKEQPAARKPVDKNALSARSGKQAQQAQPAQQQQREQDASRKRKAGGKTPPATPALEDKTSSSAPPSTPAGDGASPTSPPAKSSRSSEAGSDADGMDDADAAVSPQDFPSLADAAAVPARRRGSEWQEVTRGGKSKGKGDSPPASAPTPAAELRLQAELGRRAVNISKEIFEAAGVPVPPGYTKVGSGDLRRVFKQIAR
jgi:hypothetical protein